MGNHDSSNKLKAIKSLFEEIVYQKEIRVGHRKLVLSHYPFLTWSGVHYGVINVHGHIHSRPGVPTDLPLSELHYDVGVDNNNYTPVNIEQIKENIKNYEICRTERRDN